MTVSSPYTINSCFKFLVDLENFIVIRNSLMSSLVVVSLFTIIPIDIACLAIQSMWPDFAVAIDLELDVAIKVVEFCLASNCFVFEDKFYKKLKGTTMDSPDRKSGRNCYAVFREYYFQLR